MLNNSKNKKFSQQHLNIGGGAGFTLIELMIAIAVFSIGLIASLGLASKNYNDSQDNVDKIIAVNLAREGIELIRNVRDSNWLNIEDNVDLDPGLIFEPYTWDRALTSFPVTNKGYLYMDYTDNFPKMLASENCMDGLSFCNGSDGAGNPNMQLYKNVNNFYVHDNSFTATKYYRGLKLYKICLKSTFTDPLTDEYDNIEANQFCNVSDTQVGIRVISYVQWEDNGNIESVKVTDKLYNWRR